MIITYAIKVSFTLTFYFMLFLVPVGLTILHLRTKRQRRLQSITQRPAQLFAGILLTWTLTCLSLCSISLFSAIAWAHYHDGISWSQATDLNF